MRRASVAILLVVWAACVAALPQHVAQSSASTRTWHWFESCDGNNLGLVVLVDGKVAYRSQFPVCRNNGPTPTAEERKIVFHFKGGRVFQGEYRTLPAQTIEVNIWQAGADPDSLLLGITFVSDRILLNTIHVAKPDRTSVSRLDRGIIVRTFPLTRNELVKHHAYIHNPRGALGSAAFT